MPAGGEADDRTPDQPAPSFSDAMAAAARRSGLGHVRPGEAPSGRALLAAVGGIRGLVESILPPLLFLVVFTITQQLVPSVLAPLGLAVVFIAARVVMRQPVMTAVVGALGVGVSAGLALLSGRASDNFLPGLIINVVLLVAMLLSIAVRRPLIGVMAGTPRRRGSRSSRPSCGPFCRPSVSRSRCPSTSRTMPPGSRR